MRGIFQPLLTLDAFSKIRGGISRGIPLLVSGVGDSVQNHLSAALTLAQEGMSVVIAPNDMKAHEIYEDMSFYFPGSTAFFPAKDPLFYSADVHGSAIEEDRIKVIRRLMNYEIKVLVISIEALYDRMIPAEVWNQYILHRRLGGTLDPTTLSTRLTRMGYQRRDAVEHAGQFSIRGGIVDIYPIGEETAIRIELWDDEIDSIRVLDAETQRSAHRLEDFTVYPATEVLVGDAEIEKASARIRNEKDACRSKMEKAGLDEEAERIEQINAAFLERLETERYRGLEAYLNYFYDKTYTILDYVPEDTVIILQEPGRIREKIRVLEAELENSIRGRIQKGYLLPGQGEMFPTFAEIEPHITRYHYICMCSLLASNQAAFPVKELISLPTRSVTLMAGNEGMLLEELKGLNRTGYKTLLMAESSTRVQRLLARLREEEIAAYAYEEGTELRESAIAVAKGGLAHGFVYPEIKFAVIAQRELSARSGRSHKRRKRFKSGQQVKSFGELTVGDYVVHENHGVGVYHGIVQLETDDTKRDFFKIVYKDGGVLYVPTTSLDMLQRYVGGEDAKPKLNKLGGQEWGRTKRKVKESVAKLAEDLVALYAEREAGKGYIYSPDTVWQKEFEEMFPYEETEDQLDAIADVKKDMETGKVMDRLICGDVGYGKTEVAIRAAFKAVQDGKQVALLAPTTILAQQHYQTLVSRMRDFPIKIGILSRFRTPKEIQETLKETRQGMVDILVGTHRLLSKDVVFKDLGLLIVDEEQRFGVGHKEKIKNLKKDVDVMTLTATPIPRTLHMSMNGIRDMSVLEEPPQERQPIQTFVMEEDDELIREAIYREIGRGGQVFFLHNRVRSIDQVALKVQQLVPEARVSFAHGQMSEKELEAAMMQFVEGEVDVLVCTTIIETGLDISNVNTIIIENADTMGLAQLYQLRGRVGRSNRVAYAYFVYRKGKVLQEEAQKRLEAIGEFTEFGSGFKIAMRDLEIRGAGNVLGPEQHGHMGAVGYELYCKLLEEAMNKVRRIKEPEHFETTISLNTNAFIPSTYISNESQKLEVYKKIAAIQTEEDYLDMQEELIDRYADPPRSVQNLVQISFIKALASNLGIDQLDGRNQVLVLSFREDAPLDMAALMQYLKENPLRVRVTNKGGVTRMQINLGQIRKDRVVLDTITKELKDLQKIKASDHEEA